MIEHSKAKPTAKQAHVTEAPKPIVKAPEAKKPSRESVLAGAKDLKFAESITPITIADGPLASVANSLEPNTFVACKREDVPAEIWERHVKGYDNQIAHGNKLTADPEICGLFRDEAGVLGLLVAYKAVQNTGR